MDKNCGKTLSVWTDTFKVREFETLKENTEAEVCIIGAGISGITCAYLLASEGKKVIVIDDGIIGGGETGNTTAHISSVIDDGFSRMEELHGKDAANLASQSQRSAVYEIEKIIQKENILCDFKKVDGYLFFKPDDTLFTEEHEAAMRAGMEVEISTSPLKSFEDHNTLKFPGQAQFHVLKYVSALAGAILRMNGKIFTGTFANRIEDSKENVIINTRNGFSIKTRDAVIATNSPISDYLAIHTKQSAYRTYVIGYKIKKNSVPVALYWDTEEPYHYIRVHPHEENDVLIIGGEDHKTGQEEDPEERFERLEEWSIKHFDGLTLPEYKWSGQVIEPVDGLSYLGKDPENSEHVYIMTGDSGMGMTHATYGGMLLCDLIVGKENRWSELYDPKRITVKSAGEFIKEGANVLSQYVDFVTPGNVENAEDVKSEEGAVLRDGFEKFAVYKDSEGNVHKFSALCPHLKCVLHWNNVEKSWDCPCHGSRFDCIGKVLNGPAISDMKKISINETAK